VALLQSCRSIESRLNQMHFEHFIGPPSSVRLSLIDRMENDSLPDDLFLALPQNAEKLHAEFGRMGTPPCHSQLSTSHPLPEIKT
jgi:hypothetical protein